MLSSFCWCVCVNSVVFGMDRDIGGIFKTKIVCGGMFYRVEFKFGQCEFRFENTFLYNAVLFSTRFIFMKINCIFLMSTLNDFR